MLLDDPAAYDMKLMASDVTCVLDDLKIDRTHYWGYFLGGTIAFALAEYDPERVPSLVIGGMHTYALVPADYRELFKRGNEALISEWEAQRMLMTPEVRSRLEAVDTEAMYAIVANGIPGRPDVLPKTDMPRLVYCGDADELYDGAQECVKRMPNVTFVSMPSLNHMEALVHSDLVLPHATKFLKKLQPG